MSPLSPKIDSDFLLEVCHDAVEYKDLFLSTSAYMCLQQDWHEIFITAMDFKLHKYKSEGRDNQLCTRLIMRTILNFPLRSTVLKTCTVW